MHAACVRSHRAGALKFWALRSRFRSQVRSQKTKKRRIIEESWFNLKYMYIYSKHLRLPFYFFFLLIRAAMRAYLSHVHSEVKRLGAELRSYM